MSTQQSINKCVSRIESHLNSKNPDLNIVHAELRFLDSLSGLARNGIEVDTSGPKDAKEEDTTNRTAIKFPKGTVLVLMGYSGNREEQESKMLSHLKNDIDWKADIYKVGFVDNPSKEYYEFISRNPVDRSSKYTLHSGEIAYLIKIA